MVPVNAWSLKSCGRWWVSRIDGSGSKAASAARGVGLKSPWTEAGWAGDVHGMLRMWPLAADAKFQLPSNDLQNGFYNLDSNRLSSFRRLYLKWTSSSLIERLSPDKTSRILKGWAWAWVAGRLGTCRMDLKMEPSRTFTKHRGGTSPRPTLDLAQSWSIHFS